MGIKPLSFPSFAPVHIKEGEIFMIVALRDFGGML